LAPIFILKYFTQFDKIIINSSGAPASLARKIAAAKKEAAKARAGKNSFPPTPFLFARPSGKVFVPAERSSAIKVRSPDFRQSKFGFRPTNTTKNKLFPIYKK